MCGILGIITRKNTTSPLTQRDILAMRDTMAARGPDESGLFQKNNCVAAHCRLAIRDREGGKQPWVSPDGRWVLVYNGEIYNDVELRERLKRKGVEFRTRSDTEVLMNAWTTWGPACINRFQGMFAFGIIDTLKNQWWLVRDRCGVKPLYYATIENDFVFASSIKAIIRHPRFLRAPDLVTVRHYLSTLRLTFDQRTMFQGIHTVRPAEIIHGSDGILTAETWWSPYGQPIEPMTFDEAADELEQRLRTAVSMRLRSDVPVGMMLSGGVDSNVLASLVKQENPNTMTGRCGGGVDSEVDESDSDFQHARVAAQTFGFDYDEVRVDQATYRSTWEGLIEDYATPLATPTDVVIYQIAQSLKQKVGVAIGGEGADEAFCGYSIPHWAGADFDRASSLQNERSPEAQAARESLQQQYGRDRFFSPSDHYLATNGLIPRSAQTALFLDSAWGQADSERLVERYYDQQFESQGDQPMVQKYAQVLFRLNLESLLSRLDSATMAASLEAHGSVLSLGARKLKDFSDSAEWDVGGILQAPILVTSR